MANCCGRRLFFGHVLGVQSSELEFTLHLWPENKKRLIYKLYGQITIAVGLVT